MRLTRPHFEQTLTDRDRERAARNCLDVCNFGPALQSLYVTFEGDEAHAQMINAAIVVISRLPNLTDIALELPAFFPALSFAPLAAAAQLQDLILYTYCNRSPAALTLQQLDQLRMLPQLRKMSVEDLASSGLVDLLRAPHSLQWQEIHQVEEIHVSEAAALSTLPTLTALDTDNCRSVGFLPSLRRLRTLELYLDRTVRLAADVVAGLPCCSQPTDLRLLAADVTPMQLSQALSQMPLLRSLTLSVCSSLDTLSFLSDCPHLAQSLQTLELYSCFNPALHSTELKHILSLRRLRLTSLRLGASFVEPLDACTRHLLKPPSLVLPALKEFEYIH